MPVLQAQQKPHAPCLSADGGRSGHNFFFTTDEVCPFCESSLWLVGVLKARWLYVCQGVGDDGATHKQGEGEGEREES